jgi:para-nitrobenzyl esterase
VGGLTRRTFVGSAVASIAATSSPVTGARGATRRSHDEVVITTPAGRFRGVRRGATACFRGIRYGRAERFRAPDPVPAASGIADALDFAPACPQGPRTYLPQSEDCLALNVWSPVRRAAAPRPVLVYVHGGAYSTGSVADPLNDGERLATFGDVVVVTVNHRLNAFGYLSLARFDDRFPDSGNAGQLDLVLALRWVRDNVAAFGGDPACVTVFGQSGGGAKIATLLAMPAADGLFHRAITMSGQQVTASGPLNATRRAHAYLAKLGVDPATADVSRLVAALDAIDPVLGGSVYFGPVVDGRNLPRHPFYPDAAPQGLRVPLLLGNTLRETRAFFPATHPKLVGLDWSNLAERLGPELRVDIAPERVVAEYRRWFPDYGAQDVFYAATTAGRSWRGQVIEAEERARAGAPAFVYELDFENAKHTDDIGLAFGTTAAESAARAEMSRTVMAAFVRFARTGNPGWPAYELRERATMVFDVDSRVVSDPRGRERELFAQVPFVQAGT